MVNCLCCGADLQNLLSKNDVCEGCVTNLIERNAVDELEKYDLIAELKEKYKTQPPRYVVLKTPVDSTGELKDICKQTWPAYHIDISYCPESDEYKELFYNYDLRSIMGTVLEYDSESITWSIDTEAYRSGGGCWQEYWEKLLSVSEITTWG